jgi:hypothetical protein
MFYFVAVLLHLANNFIALLAFSFAVIPGIIVVAATYLSAWRLYNRTSETVVV